MTHEAVATPWEQKGLVMRSLLEKADGELVLVDGVKVCHGLDWALALPDPAEPVTHLWAEAALGRRGPRTVEGLRATHPTAGPLSGAARLGFPVMNVPDDLRYSKDHEWVSVETRRMRARVRIGITDYAQDALGDVVFVQVPDVGTAVQAGESFGEVESTKSVSDIYAPVTGTVVEVNDALAEHPESLNGDPYGEGWLCVIEVPDVDGDRGVAGRRRPTAR